MKFKLQYLPVSCFIALVPAFAATDPASAQAPATLPASPPVNASIPKAIPPAPGISPELAAKLHLGAPKFIPPGTVEEKPPSSPTDKAKNGIVRLPAYVVRDHREPTFRERDIYTSDGLAGLAMKRYLTETYRAMNPFTLPLFGTPPEARAMAMYREDERLKNMADLKDAADLVSTRDKASGNAVRRETQKLYMRRRDSGR